MEGLITLSQVDGIGAKTLSKVALNLGIDVSIHEYIAFLQSTDKRGKIQTILAELDISRFENEAHHIQERCKELGIHIVTWEDPGYPQLMRRLPLPPPFLYAKGSTL